MKRIRPKNSDPTFLDEYTQVFDDFVATPNGPRVKPAQLYKYQEPWDDEKFMNAMTLGGFNNLSASQWIRRGYDAVTGNLTADSWLNGNSGIVSDKFAQNHPYLSTVANTVVDIATPWGYFYSNPKSLLNRNIRTALYNDKIPFGYNVLDANIPKSFMKGTYKTLLGEEIQQLAEPTWFKTNRGNVLGFGEGSNDVMTRMLARHRAAAWARYLGLDDTLQGAGYIKSRPGWVTKEHDPYFKELYSSKIIGERSRNGVKLSGTIRDNGVYDTHGYMGYEINPETNVARVFDVWDLQPFRHLNIPFLKNFEASQVLPGAKPFNFETFVSMER